MGSVGLVRAIARAARVVRARRIHRSGRIFATQVPQITPRFVMRCSQATSRVFRQGPASEHSTGVDRCSQPTPRGLELAAQSSLSVDIEQDDGETLFLFPALMHTNTTVMDELEGTHLDSGEVLEVIQETLHINGKGLNSAAVVELLEVSA